jgi:hypothetical protein
LAPRHGTCTTVFYKQLMGWAFHSMITAQMSTCRLWFTWTLFWPTGAKPRYLTSSRNHFLNLHTVSPLQPLFPLLIAFSGRGCFVGVEKHQNGPSVRPCDCWGNCCLWGALSNFRYWAVHASYTWYTLKDIIFNQLICSARLRTVLARMMRPIVLRHQSAARHLL